MGNFEIGSRQPVRGHGVTGRVWLGPVVWLACLAPLLWLAWGLAQDRLGANPIEVFTRSTGEWALRLLLLTLAVTPLRRLTGWKWPQRLRRLLGLYAFFYATVHLVSYLWLDQFFDWGEIGRDILKRPFITAGMSAWLLLLPLALTSTRGMMRRLGGRWKRLHRLVYVVAVLAVLHFFWLVKLDVRPPLVYATLLAVLYLLRLRPVRWPGVQRRQENS